MKMRKKIIAVLLSVAMLSTTTIHSLLLADAGDVPEKTAYATYRVEDADGFSEQFDFENANDGTGGKSACGNALGRYFMFKNVDFGDNILNGVVFEAACAAGGAGADGYYSQLLEIRIDSLDGPIIGGYTSKNTGGWQNWQDQNGFINDKISGKHDVYFRYLNNAGNINRVKFTSGESFKYAYDWYNAVEDVDSELTYAPMISGAENYGQSEYGNKNISDADYTGHSFAIKDVDFCKGILGGVAVRYTTAAGGPDGVPLGQQMEIWIDGDSTDAGGTQIGAFYGRSTGGWTDAWKTINGVITEEVDGIHTVYFKFLKHDGRINAVSFLKKNTTVIDPFAAPFNAVDADINAGLGYEGDTNLRGTGGSGWVGQYFGFENLDFGKDGLGAITISQATPNDLDGVCIEVYMDSPNGTKIGEFSGLKTGNWNNWQDANVTALTKITGVHTIYFVFKQQVDLNIHTVTFTKAEKVNRSAYKRFYIFNEWDDQQDMHNETHSTSDGGTEANVNAKTAGAWWKFEDIDFGENELGGVTFSEATATAGEVGTMLNTRLSIWVDGKNANEGGTKIGSFAPKQTGGWHNYENVDGKIVQSVSGVHDVYFVCDDGQYNLTWVQFKKGTVDDNQDPEADLTQYDITVNSNFDGYNSVIDRSMTGVGDDLQPAYNYGVFLMKLDDGTYRAYSGGRWRSEKGDGDHVILYASDTGKGYTWNMVGDGPVFWQGQEEGVPDKWYSKNQLEPEVMKLPDGTWVMYSQCEIEGGTPIDDVAGTPSQNGIWADRIQLLTSKDGITWTRKTDRGVITNIPDAQTTSFHHQEMLYVPWDKDGKCYWMYVALAYKGVNQGFIRIRSSSYDTFNFNDREAVGGMTQLGNQIGYLKEAPGGVIFVRTTMMDSNGRIVPALQYSGDGLTWNAPQTMLKGSENNEFNKNCYFVGLSTINGTGQIEYLGNNQWAFLYAATTANSPVALSENEGWGIWKSQIGGGSATLTLSVKDQPQNPNYNLYKISTGKTDDIISTLFPVQMQVEEDAQSAIIHEWSVDDTSVAIIDNKGVLTPKKAGTVLVTLKADGRSKTCMISIKEGIPTLETDDVRVLKGSTKQMTFKIALKDAEEKYTTTLDASKVDWSVSNTGLATINETGLVTAKSNGKVKVVAGLKDNPKIKAELELTIVNGYIDIELQNSSNIDSISADMTPRMTAISYSIGSKEIVWSVDEKKATIKDLNNVDTPENNSNIKVMFKDSGKIVFRASLKDYPEVYSEVVFTVIPTKLELSMALDNATYFDMNDYTALRWNNLQKAIKVARAVYDDADATQAEINEAVALLERVVSELELADDVQTPAIPDQIGGSATKPENSEKPSDPSIPDTFNDSLEIFMKLLLLGAAAAVIYKTSMKKRKFAE